MSITRDAATFSIFYLEEKENPYFVKRLTRIPAFKELKKICTSPPPSEAKKDRSWNSFIWQYLTFNWQFSSSLPGDMKEIYTAFNQSDSKKNEGDVDGTRAHPLNHAILLLRNEESKKKKIQKIKILLMLAAGHVQTDEKDRVKALFLLAELAVDKNDLALGFEYFMHYLFCLHPDPQKPDISVLVTIRDHMREWQERHPRQTHAFIEMMGNFLPEIYNKRVELRPAIHGKKKITAEEFYQLIREKVVEKLLPNNTQEGVSRNKTNPDDQPWMFKENIRAFYLQITDPATRQYLLNHVYPEQPSQYASFKSDGIFFAKQLSTKTEGDANKAQILNGYLVFDSKNNEKTPLMLCQGEINGAFVSPSQRLIDTCLKKDAKGSNPSIQNNLTQVNAFYRNVGTMVAATITSKRQEQKKIAEVKKTAAAEAQKKATERLRKLYQLRHEINKPLWGRMRLFFKKLAIMWRILKLRKQVLALDPQMTSQKMTLRMLAKTLEEKSNESKKEATTIGSVEKENKTSSAKEVSFAEAQALELFWKEFNDTSISALLRYGKDDSFLKTLRPNEKNISLERIILYAMKEPVNLTWRGQVGGNKVARILHHLFHIRLDKMPPKKPFAGFEVILPPTPEEREVKAIFERICENDQKALDQFHTNYQADIDKRFLPAYGTHREKSQKTLVRIIEETKNAPAFSCGIFSTCKRSHKIFEAMGASTKDDKNSSEQIRNDLVRMNPPKPG